MGRPKKPTAEDDSSAVEEAPDIQEHDTFTLKLDDSTTAPSSPLPNKPTLSRRRNPPTLKIVLEAIQKLDDQKGSTYIAIKNWTLANYPEVNRKLIKFMLCKALEKGVKDGQLRHLTASSHPEPPTAGRYKIEKKVKKPAPKKESRPKKKATSSKMAAKEPETVSDTEVETAKSLKAASHRRRSKSESEFEETKKALNKAKAAPKKAVAAKKSAKTVTVSAKPAKSATSEERVKDASSASQKRVKKAGTSEKTAKSSAGTSEKPARSARASKKPAVSGSSEKSDKNATEKPSKRTTAVKKTEKSSSTTAQNTYILEERAHDDEIPESFSE